jgi:lysophospholipase L1-like esterase
VTRAERAPLRVVLAGALGAVTLLTGCDVGRAATSDPSPTAVTSSSTPEGPVSPTAYVALGDSFTAAPFVPVTDVAGGCFRSDSNYPALVAEELSPATFVDVSCGGAASRDLVRPQSVAEGRAQVPPQLRAVRPEADLVTVGIGGNDGNLFTQLVCGFTRQRFAQCDVASTADVESTLARTRTDVAQTLRRVVRAAAPDALVLLVGYPRLVDTSRTCPALPLRGEQLAQVARVEQRLRSTLMAAARQAGAQFLDLYDASLGHEICSDDPWINGERTDRSQALAYHPFAAEQEAVAGLVAQRWKEHLS